MIRKNQHADGNQADMEKLKDARGVSYDITA